MCRNDTSLSSIVFSVKQLKENPVDYDTWFDYLRLLESEGDFNATREAYEKAIAQLPPIQVRIVELVISISFISIGISRRNDTGVVISISGLITLSSKNWKLKTSNVRVKFTRPV